MWPAAVATAGVFAIVMAATVALSGPATAPGPATGSSAYRLPRSVTGAAETAPVSTDPPGRAIVLFVRGGQKVVLATDGVSFRRLDVADENQAALLSPDGRAVVLSDPTATTGRVDVVDLGTGAVTRYAIADPLALRPLAWSPDGRRVAFATQVAPPWNGAGPAGVSVLNLDTRAMVAVADPRPDTGLGHVYGAFTPTGTGVLVSAGAEPGCRLRLYRVDQPMPADPIAVEALDDRCGEVAALSVHPAPDRAATDGVPPMTVVVGEFLGNTRRLSLRDMPFGMSAAPSATIELGPDDRVLGWDGSDGIYVASTSEVTRVSVDGQSRTTLVVFPADQVSGFQVAVELVPQSTPLVPEPQLLPLSPLRTAAIIVLVLGLAALVVLTLLWRRAVRWTR